MTASPFAAPATTSGIDLKALNGSLLCITVRSVERDIQTSYGPTDAIKADVAVLDGADKGDEYNETLIFPRVLRSQLESKIGEKVLGRLGQGTAKPGQSAPWMLAAATPADVEVGVAYLANGFSKPQASATTAAGEPPF